MAKSKLRTDNSGFVRIGNKAIKIAKANKKKTGIPIGKFIEQAVYAFDTIYNQVNNKEVGS